MRPIHAEQSQCGLPFTSDAISASSLRVAAFPSGSTRSASIASSRPGAGGPCKELAKPIASCQLPIFASTDSPVFDGLRLHLKRSIVETMVRMSCPGKVARIAQVRSARTCPNKFVRPFVLVRSARICPDDVARGVQDRSAAIARIRFARIRPYKVRARMPNVQYLGKPDVSCHSLLALPLRLSMSDASCRS